MFSRRTTQTLLNGIIDLLPAVEAADLVRRLNTPRARLAAIWETAVCYGLSRAGNISFHSRLPSGSKPDIAFSLADNRQISFVADVTTISDDGYHNENPIGEFLNDFVTVVRSGGLDPSKFDFRIESRKIGRKIKLLIPEPSQRLAALQKHVLPFVREIAKGGFDKLQRTFSEPDLAMTVSYDQQQRYMSWSHRPYNQAKSVDKNPLGNGLEKKADQLKGVEVLAGVIVCDGGCALLSGSMRDVDAFSADDIIQKFLRSSSSIDFVYTVTIRCRRFNDDCSFEGHLWFRDPATKTLIEPIMRSALENLPPPIFDAKNAAIEAEQKGYNFGARAKDFSYGIDGEKIMSVNMSARRLLEILAGKHSPSDIDSICGGPADDHPGWPNPFKKALAKGQLIKEIVIEPISGRDDDQVTIRFGESDPAVSPFRGRRKAGE